MNRRRLVIALGLVVLLGSGWAGTAWYRSRLSVNTDDAYVEGTVAPVSAKVPGQVIEVLVRDNEVVRAGQVVVRLDARDYRAKAEQVRAAVVMAERRFGAAAARVGLGREMAASQFTQAEAASMRAQAARQSAVSILEGSRATAHARRAALASAVADRDGILALRDRTRLDLERAEELFARELVAKQFVDNARADARVAAAQFAASDQRVAQAQRDLETAEADARMREAGFEPQQIGLRTAEARVLEARAQEQQAGALVQEVRVREAERDLAEAQLKEAQADLALAMLNVEYTEIRAPVAGVVTRKNVEPGQVAQPGQPMLAVVSLDDVWVIANLKETQLHAIRPGMRAVIVVDTFSDRAWQGKVDSIAAGTGSRFSLLPPENATGNWVKIVQRVPVKIVLDSGQARNPHTLRAGMSAAVTIHLR
ncbi:MAG: HlyD family secretion protein [Candidatus Rokuibacteriota bacterium]|nr:MAG: HlyD family secretion protein [Candidatus Rokubacteria bacterium]